MTQKCVICEKQYPGYMKEPGWTHFSGYPFRSNTDNPVPAVKFFGLTCGDCSEIIHAHFGHICPIPKSYTPEAFTKLAVQARLKGAMK